MWMSRKYSKLVQVKQKYPKALYLKKIKDDSCVLIKYCLS